MSKKPISEKQSQSLVKELVSVSLNCITFLRNVFSDECYIDSKFISKETADSKNSFVKVKYLMSGISREADTFINWVECGISSALKLQYLRALQFAIHIDDEHPERLSEAYVFNFDYKSENITLSINEQEKYHVLPELSAREKIQQLIRRIIVSTQTFEPLPEKKHISVRLLFNERCPPDYQPSFFMDASNLEPPTISIDMKKCMHDIGTFHTNYNYASIKILSNIGVSMKYPVKIDPFDIISEPGFQKNIDNKIDFPKVDSSLSLNKFLQTNKPSDIPSTQIVPFTQLSISTKYKATCECNCWNSEFRIKLSVKGFSIMTCHTCQRKVHSCCYGFNLSTSIRQSTANFECYSCLLDNDINEEDLILLMRLRYLWKYMSCYDIPQEFNFFYEIFDLRPKFDDRVVRKMLNKLFQDKILIVLDAPVTVRGNRLAAGTGTFVADIDMLRDNKGNPIYENKIYSVAFTPGVKTQKITFDTVKHEFYLPDIHNTKNYILNLLEKFKASFKDLEFDDDPIESSSLSFDQEGSLKERDEIFERPLNESVHKNKQSANLIEDKMNELSFEDSLNFLSQTVNEFDSHSVTSIQDADLLVDERSKRKLHEEISDNTDKLKMRKISVNKEPCV